MRFKPGDWVMFINNDDCDYDLTLNKIYEVSYYESSVTTQVIDDNGRKVQPYSWRFKKIDKELSSIEKEIRDIQTMGYKES